MQKCDDGKRNGDTMDHREGKEGQLDPDDEVLLEMPLDNSDRLTRDKAKYFTEDYEENDRVSLVHGRHERIPFKDFFAEVRGFRDLEIFLENTVLLLDMPETGMTEIFERLIREVSEQENLSIDMEEAKQALFTHDSVHVLGKTIQGTSYTHGVGFDYDQSWIVALCELPLLLKRYVAIGRLRHAANLGSTSQEVRFVILVLAPSKEKTTKNAMETGRTFATLFVDLEFKHLLLDVKADWEFKALLSEHAKKLAKEQGNPDCRNSHLQLTAFDDLEGDKSRCPIARGMIGDLKRRLPHYFSDYKDGIYGNKTIHKVTSTTLFLYFACVLPNIAFGMLNDTNTHGAIGVKKILFSQCVGGIIFAVFGGQPLIVLLTTAPLALYTKIIFSICEDFKLNFYGMFACVGLWNTFFLLIFSIFDVSKMMKWSSRSTEEIFSLFITCAFSADAIRDTVRNFKSNYYNEACQNLSAALTSVTPSLDVNMSVTDHMTQAAPPECLKENSILFLLLMLGTLWLGLTLYNFTTTPFLNAGRREILADYALPTAVLIMSVIGSVIFRDIQIKPFSYNPDEELFVVAPLHTLPPAAWVAAAGLGFSLSLLFFMDQNISSALVNTPAHKLKKGAAYHWDLFVVAVINGFLSVFAFPWVHAALPHSPLHSGACA
ncbi:solute carrier family 4 member 11-like isoform X2 [Liolophura sinensis]|uniref:solute carrier family 4 member 11-like isoform X2 n=1 Tax=Liolophura sinensis TaxID=3198878 RepID=UPI003158B37B